MRAPTLVGGRERFPGVRFEEMSELPKDDTGVAAWHRLMLPGEMLEAPGGRRSPRDWVVDAALFVAALVVGVLSLSSISADRSDPGIVVDFLVGTAVCLTLWVRRRHPVGVAVLAGVVSTFAAMAGGAVVFAIFNAAIRASRRALIGIVALALVSTVVFPLLYPSVGSWVTQVLLGCLLIAVALGWGLFTRARREVIRSSSVERAERLESEQRLRVGQAREAERRPYRAGDARRARPPALAAQRACGSARVPARRALPKKSLNAAGVDPGETAQTGSPGAEGRDRRPSRRVRAKERVPAPTADTGRTLPTLDRRSASEAGMHDPPRSMNNDD